VRGYPMTGMAGDVSRAAAAIFDVNETISDQQQLAHLLIELGAPSHLLPTWFASVLRDGIALTAAGGFASFRELGLANARTLFTRHNVSDVDGAAERLVAGMAQLGVHPDIADGMQVLYDAGITIAALTNGSVEVTEAILERAGLLGLVQHRLDVQAVKKWKPHPDAYRYALETVGVGAADAVMVAVHPWDVDGAQRAGLHGAWLNRDNASWPEPFLKPQYEARDLLTLAKRIVNG
jgi:2-haloacid dehalogenase